jgi:hypothetical protein
VAVGSFPSNDKLPTEREVAMGKKFGQALEPDIVAGRPEKTARLLSISNLIALN